MSKAPGRPGFAYHRATKQRAAATIAPYTIQLRSGFMPSDVAARIVPSGRCAFDRDQTACVAGRPRNRRVRLTYITHMGAGVEYERKKVRFRPNRGRREKARKGRVPGGPVPSGYPAIPTRQAATPSSRTRRRVVRQMYTRVLDSVAVRTIASRLQARGTPAPRGRWSPFSVRQVLRRENLQHAFGAGASTRGAGVVLRGPWPAAFAPPRPATGARRRPRRSVVASWLPRASRRGRRGPPRGRGSAPVSRDGP